MASMKEEGIKKDNLMQKCTIFSGSYIGDYEITIFRDVHIHWFTQRSVRSTFSLYPYYSFSHRSLFYFEGGSSRAFRNQSTWRRFSEVDIFAKLPVSVFVAICLFKFIHYS
jgi:hypothetical protein